MPIHYFDFNFVVVIVLVKRTRVSVNLNRISRQQFKLNFEQIAKVDQPYRARRSRNFPFVINTKINISKHFTCACM